MECVSVAAREQPDLSLVIVAYNEEACIENTVTDLVRELTQAKVSFELVVVDNGSTDRTGQVIRNMAKCDRRLRPVRVERNRGYGFGVLYGLRVASGKWLGYMGADGQIAPSDVIRTFKLVKDGECDLAKVIRVKRGDGAFRAFLSATYNRFLHLVFPSVGTRDVNGVPKFFSAELFKKLDLRSKGWFIDTELMVQAMQRFRPRVSEVPVVFKPRAAGKSYVKPKIVVELLLGIVRLKLGGC